MATTTELATTATLPAELAGAAKAALGAIEDAQAPNTRRAYASALANYDAWRDLRGLPVADESLALYLGALIQGGRSAALGSMVVNAARARGDKVGGLAKDALAGFRRQDAPRAKRQAKALSLENVGAMLAVAGQPRKRGRGMETAEQAAKRGRQDAAMLGCLFYGALRRSEVAALKVGDVAPQDDGCVLVNVRASKGNQHGDAEDVRLIVNGAAGALAALVVGREAGASVFGLSASQVNNRVQALARQAGVVGRVSAHSGRRGMATELVKRGADTASVMLAGGWKSPAMVSRYASGVRAKEGAVARYLREG